MLIKYTASPTLDLRAGNIYHDIRYRVSYDGNKVSFKVGYQVNKDKWVKEMKRCKLGTSHGKRSIPAAIINRELDAYDNIVRDVFLDFERKDLLPTPDQLRYEFNLALGKVSEKVDVQSFFEVYDEFVTTMSFQNAWAVGTVKRFGVLKSHLTKFDKDIDINKLDEPKMQGFVKYLYDADMSNPTISKLVSQVRWFLRWAFNKLYYTGTLHKTFRPRLKGVDGNNKEVIHLTNKELLKVYKYEFIEDNISLERVRDVFCFCCFTGLRYSDVAALKRSDVKSTCIEIVTQKTADGLKIELNNYSKAILDKYADQQLDNDCALPIISQQKMNDYIKVLGKLIGIDTPQRQVRFKGNQRIEEVHPKWQLLSSHCGRRTFIVNALYLGIPAETIMKWTGHSDYKAMKPYVKIVDELKEREMSKFNLLE